MLADKGCVFFFKVQKSQQNFNLLLGVAVWKIQLFQEVEPTQEMKRQEVGERKSPSLK